jgi:hypothetical protein
VQVGGSAQGDHRVPEARTSRRWKGRPSGRRTCSAFWTACK